MPIPKIDKIELNLVGAKRKLFVMFFGYQLSLFQVFFITPAVMLFFASLVIIATLIQENGGQDYVGKILYILFLGNEGHFDDGRVIGIYLTYVFVFAFLIEVFNSIFRKKFEFSLKLKLKLVLGFFLVTYSIIAVWIFVTSGFADSMVIVFFLLASLILGSIGISLSHVLGVVRKALNNIEIDYKR